MSLYRYSCPECEATALAEVSEPVHANLATVTPVCSKCKEPCRWRHVA